jgi:hypothetical protein
MHAQRLLSFKSVDNSTDDPAFRLGIRGTTLLEVLVAALIASFAVAAGMQLLINQNQNHLIQEGITSMQHNGRVTVDELVEKIRRAGYQLPAGLPAVIAWNSNPDTIAIAFLVEPVCTASISDPMPQPSSELKCKDSELSCFSSDVWAYIHDPFVDSGEFFFITHVQEAAGHLQHNTMPLSKKYPVGSEIFMLDYYKYYVDNSDTTHPLFMMEKNGDAAVIYADNIEDLQFRYTMADGSVADTISLARFLRQVTVQVVARTEEKDLFMNTHRKDTLTTSVQVRNLRLGA